MKKLFKKIFDSNAIKRAIISYAYEIPGQTEEEYKELSRALRNLEDSSEEIQAKIQVKKL